MIEAVIACEKGGASQAVQQRNDLIPVLHPKIPNIGTDSSKGNVPCFELPALARYDVFVEDVHAARRRFSLFSTRASRASSTASAIASGASRPSYSVEI